MITSDMTVTDIDTEDYDALVLPGGVGNPDKLRMDERTGRDRPGFCDDGKTVAAICHAP